MSLRTTAYTAITAAAAASALTIAATPAAAEPGSTARYQAEVVNGTVVTTLDAASFTLADDRQSVLAHDDVGQLVLALPLVFELDGVAHPINQQILDAGHTLVLAPDTLRPIASPLENQLALDEFAGNMTKASLAATVGGFVIGALVGAVIGLGSCLLVGPGCLATAPAAILAFAGGGSLAATLALGGGALGYGLWKYITTLQAAPGHSEYANHDGLLDPDGTGVPNANLRIPPLALKPLITGSASGSAH
ncbi:hypothetical protein KO481_16135 [Nocardia sp. NEAU-G5]|uniref:DUF8020 domain-containing protein n=1 Tax=Nocardia albiluteola TaxID=2842303 RepID=A0ABS6AYD1_9NOCA|nr:hypothetical protein [Nocardia albiluteola]MBU3063049.1 hypothetical protein [Nocardia albiluteola]